MKTNETLVLPQSEVFFYTPSLQAQKMFFYPICLGHYYYAAHYQLNRTSFDSFLLMYIIRGECTIVSSGKSYLASSGQLVFLDCYQAHEYSSSTGWECLWIHFDGPLAPQYYKSITDSLGPVLSLPQSYLAEKNLQEIFTLFSQNKIIKEALISRYITTILTEMILVPAEYNPRSDHAHIIHRITSYIHEHPGEDLSLNRLAALANLSPYYFSRVFKKEIGKPPHEYVVSSRINSARFYLKTSQLSIEEIGLSLGFSTASSFCARFRKHEGMTPLNYRNHYRGVGP